MALLGRDIPEVSRGSNYITRRVVQSSLAYVGVPYVFGGTTPSGFDCSGYVRYVFANAGIYLPRTADAQYEVGTPVTSDELIPGDLVFFSTYEPGASHVGIYVGNNMMIHCGDPIQYADLSSSYWQGHFLAYGRVPSP